jgi:signal transduction histidine kinase
LDVTRIAAERVRFAPEVVDLTELANHVVALFERSGELAQSRCSIELYSEPSINGYWDRHHVEQVLTHLLENALKFGSGKPVEIRLDQHGAWAEITVRDHGVGIAREDQARIFERFERAVPERHYGGLGLGLWLVRSMVEAMGGHVTVRSAPHQGATFVVQLPLGEAQPSSKPEQRKSA